MFTQLNILLEKQGLPLPNISIFLCDLEQAMLKSVIEFYIVGKLQACFFHLTQNTWK